MAPKIAEAVKLEGQAEKELQNVAIAHTVPPLLVTADDWAHFRLEARADELRAAAIATFGLGAADTTRRRENLKKLTLLHFFATQH